MYMYTYIYNDGILLSHKSNEIESIVVMWVNSESVTQSEVSQKKKNKYCLLMHEVSLVAQW